MHELAICQALIEQLESIAQENQAERVTEIYLQVGPLSGAEPSLLQNAYPLAATGTVAENARLEIKTMPVRVHCNACGEESEASVNKLICAHCGDFRTRLISGDEMLLASVAFNRRSHSSIREKENVRYLRM